MNFLVRHSNNFNSQVHNDSIGVYALLDYLIRNNSKLGIITAIAVFATDLILYLYSHSQIVTSPAEISFHLSIFRICLFVLGGTYWIYGYSLLYAYFGIYLVYNIALVRFPFMEELIENEVEEMKGSENKNNMLDIASTPEFLLMAATVLFGVLLTVMKAIQPNGVPLVKRKVERENFEFWAFGLFALLLVFLVFFLILVYRIFKRKLNGIDSKVYLYVHYKQIDLFWFFLIILYSLIAAAVVLAYWVTNDKRYLIVGLFAPPSVGLLLNAYLKFALNDFNYLQDIKSLNKTITKHNKRIDNIKKRISEFKKVVASKSGGDLQNLNDDEIAEFSKQKLEYKRKEDEEDFKAVSLADEEANAKKKADEREENKENEEEYPDDEEIEEGGSDEEKDVRSAKKNQNNKAIFQKSIRFDRNIFGQAAEMILNDDEVEYDRKYMGTAKGNK